MEIDRFITINGVQITEKADFEIKAQLLTKNGATVIRNENGSITIIGPFSIIYQKNDDDFFTIINSGTINIRSDNVAILHSFNNLATGTLHVASGCLEKIFSTSTCMEPDKCIQQERRTSVNQLLP
jgi:hypothetical protein